MSTLLEAFTRLQQMVPKHGGRVVLAGEPIVLIFAHLAGHQCVLLKKCALFAIQIGGTLRLLFFVHWFEVFIVPRIDASSLAARNAGASSPRLERFRKLGRSGRQHVERTTLSNTGFHLAG